MNSVINLEKHAAKVNGAKVNGIDQLSLLVADELAAVNQLILARMESSVALIPQLAGYIIGNGGKRLRPLLTLATAKMCGYSGPRSVKLATAVEFIHTATLLHDDVVDESDLRRGNPAAHAVFGNLAAVLVGDFLYSRAFQLMTEDGSLDVLRILAQSSALIAEGEVLQLATTNDSATSEQAYLEVVQAKTAELFAAACRIGGLVAARPTAEIDALRSYGHNLGIAFQIIDDVLDYSAEQARLGKSVGDDFKEGKMTLPVILAIARADSSERAFWQRCLGDLQQQEGDFAEAQKLLAKHGCLADCVARAKHYAAIAHDALGLFADSPIKQALLATIDFTVTRDF